jgi:hypothetical protein
LRLGLHIKQRTLPLVSRHADAWLKPKSEVPRPLDLLHRLCDKAARDFGMVEGTAPLGFDVGEGGEKVGEVIGQVRWLAAMGIETAHGWRVGVDRITPLEILGREAIPAAAELRPRGDLA